jgi:hypothetical protein
MNPKRRQQLVQDVRGVSSVEFLILLAFLGLGAIGAQQLIAAARRDTSDKLGADIAQLSAFESQGGGELSAGAHDALHDATLVRAGAPTAGALQGADSDEPSTLWPAAGAVAGGIVGFLATGGAAVAGAVFSGGLNIPLIPPEVLAGTGLGAAAGYAGGLVVERADRQLSAAQAWVGERERDAIGWLGERAGAGVEWVEGLFTEDDAEAEERTKREAKQHQVEIDRAQRERRTNRRFNDYFHRKYKEDEGMPKGNRNNPDMDDEAVLEAYEEWQAQQPGHDVP